LGWGKSKCFKRRRGKLISVGGWGKYKCFFEGLEWISIRRWGKYICFLRGGE
jgi:hypothetical protein